MTPSSDDAPDGSANEGRTGGAPEADTAASDDDDRIHRRRVSRRTRRLLKDLHQRTWELELLISGAVTFVLAQIPAQVDAVFFRIDPLLGEGSGLALFMAYYYVKLILYTLIGGFGAHLLTRALWVSLVGLDSVFPRGIRWTELKLGPNMRQILPRTITSVREMIVRADGVASVIFAVSFSLVAVFGVSVVAAGLLAGGVVAGLTLLPFQVDPELLLTFLALGIVVFAAGPPLFDRFLGDRFARESWVSRVLRTLLRSGLRIQGLPIYGSIQYTLASQLGSVRYSSGLGVFIVGLVTFFIVKDVVVGQGNVVWNSTGAVPIRAGPLGVEPQHYEEYRRARRAEGRYLEPYLPTVPMEALGADDVWVRLFVPYRPGSDPDRLERLCPELEPAVGSGLRRNRLYRGTPADSVLTDDVEALGCLASLWQVEVDGIPTSVEPLFLRHPETKLPGIVRYLDTRDLAPGRHIITVRRNPHGRDPDDEDDDARPLQFDISFWR